MYGTGKTVAKIAWGLTGAGHFLPESIKLLSTLPVDLFLSKAAEEVLKAYHLYQAIAGGKNKIFYDRAASSPAVNKLYKGAYRAVVIAPATSNSIAKFVNGISDNLVTNLFAHAGKARVPVIVLPSDVSPEIDSQAPNGIVKVYPRSIDLTNVRVLETFEDVTVVKNMQELEKCISIVL